MADYKRLVSYMYNYEDGVKKNNIGFARVESRNGQCKVTIRVTVPSLNEQELKVYFFKRDGYSIEGILLGKIPIRRGIGHFRGLTESNNIMGSTYKLDDMGGLILYYVDKKYCATEWDDKPVTKEMVYVLEHPIPKEEESDKKEILEREEMIPTRDEDSIDPFPLKEYKDEALEREEVLEEETLEGEETLEEEAEELLVEESPKKLVDEIESEESLAEERKKVEAEEADIKELKAKETGKEEKVELEAEESLVDKKEELENKESFEEMTKKMASHQVQKGGKITPPPLVASSGRRKNPWPSFEEHPLAYQIYNRYPRMYPFEDNEVAWCVRFEPQDIGMLPMDNWSYGNNSFLLHGFYCYSHLIFARINDRNGIQYILGVPGIYHNREKFMARMFGFDYFKSIKRKEIRTGEFGYWYAPVYLN